MSQRGADESLVADATLPGTALASVLTASGIYAVSAVAQRSIGFLLIPVYTRVIDPTQFGMLEVLNAASAVVFTMLSLGLPSAINKCFHRDCANDGERAALLPTALVIGLPILLVACCALVALADPIAAAVAGTSEAAQLVPLIAASGLLSATTGLPMAALRAQERATAFAALSIGQFAVGLAVTITLVVGFGWGVRGVLWGSIASSAIAVPFALAAAGGWAKPNTRLGRPMLAFGTLLLPALLSGWVMNASDRYVLRLFHGLDDVALYGIGYRFGMVVDLAIVWPFQLAWPAFAFAASNRPGHRRTYARALTYLTAVLVLTVVLVAVTAREIVPIVVGSAYAQAWAVVPLVALSYAFNGIQYCVSPGVHIAGRSAKLTLLAIVAALVNLVANFALIPRMGSMGAAASTLLAFAVLGIGTTILAQRVYPVPYEYARLARIVASGLLAYVLARMMAPGHGVEAAVVATPLATTAFIALLWIGGFLKPDERAAIASLVQSWCRLSAPRRVP